MVVTNTNDSNNSTARFSVVGVNISGNTGSGSIGYYGGITASGIPYYADDAAAGVGGLTTGEVYQTNGAGASPLNVAGILMVKQ